MKILFLYWDSCFCCVDMLDAMADRREKRHDLDVVIADMNDPDSYEKEELINYISGKIKSSRCDFLFSFGFFPIISDVCEDLSVTYVSWTFDNPAVNLFTPSVKNKCNRIFVFDSDMADHLTGLGIGHVWFLPMAVNPKRLNRFVPDNEKHKIFDTDVSFVGSLYTEKHCFYDQMYPLLDERTRGYLDGLISSQGILYGVNIIEDCLTDDILASLKKARSFPHFGFETDSWTYSSYVINRKLTSLERSSIIAKAGRLFGCRLYTSDDGFHSEGVDNLGEIDYFHVMPYVFKCSQINLNITLRSIIKGIPLRCFDILGCGGFMLTNFQEDMLKFFEPGVDFVCWDDKKQIPELIAYYLENEEERNRISASGAGKVRESHTFAKRLDEILRKI